MFYRFAAAQSINASAAKIIDFLTSLPDRRQHGSLMYCMKQYVYCICFVESVYLANLSLEMMVAYNNGTIISVIKFSILSSNLVLKKIAALFAGNTIDKNVHQQLMAHVMDWYANIRDTYFVKHLKGNSGNHMKKIIDSQATRIKLPTLFITPKKFRVGWY